MKKTLLILTGVLVLNSCSDFLTLAPETSLSSATFFKNEEQLVQALMGTYAQLRPIARHGIYMDEMRSDNTFFTLYPGDRSRYLNEESIAEFLDDENSIPTTQRYPDDYKGISRANAILSRIDLVEMDDAARSTLVGEALFLRAFFYFDLVTHYGGVPLQLVELTSEDGAFLPRSTTEEVYAQIIADLNTAIPLLSIAETFPQSGRATKGAAKMLLAYAYMSQPAKDYVKAEQELRDVANMNYMLLTNYADIYNPDNKNHQESIFEIQFKEGDEGMHSDFIWRFAPKTSNAELITGVPVAIANVNWGGWNVPTQEMIDSYEAGDLRLNASVAVAEGVLDGNFLNIESVKPAAGYSPAPGKDFYYFVNKFCHAPYEKEYNTGENWPVFRYADALLLLAECLVEQGRDGEALPFLNEVRERAGLDALTAATRENVADERRHELAFENHRWTDLIRNGDAVEVMNAFGETMKGLYGWLLPAAFNVTENHLLYPIPYREMQINKNLVQNPGY